MLLLEQKTKRIEYLINLSKAGKVQQRHLAEDILPKVVIYGATENDMPKLIVCDSKRDKRKDRKSISPDQGGEKVEIIFLI